MPARKKAARKKTARKASGRKAAKKKGARKKGAGAKRKVAAKRRGPARRKKAAAKKQPSRDKRFHERPRVVIFGAGITGLSAAHELIERGFDVQVVEKRASLSQEYGVEVGGIAATQPGAVRAEPARLHPNYYEIQSGSYLDAVAGGEIDDPIVERLQDEAPAAAWCAKQRELIEHLHTVPMQRSRRPIRLTDTIRFERFGNAPRADERTEALEQCLDDAGYPIEEHPLIRELLSRKDGHQVENDYKLDRLAFRLARHLVRRLRRFGQDMRSAERYADAAVGEELDMGTLRREVMLIEIRGHTNRDLQGDAARQLGRVRARCVKALLVPRIRALLEQPKSRAKLANHISSIYQAKTWQMTERERANWLDERVHEFIEGIGDHFVLVSLAAEASLGKWWRGRQRSDRVDFKIVETLLPGEHGYRYFPAYYRHLFDTMKRTPILDARGLETGDTAFDQLVSPPATEISFADDDSQIHRIARRRHESLQEARDVLETMLDKAGLTSKDIQRFMLRMFVFLTSGKSRRETWQNQTWIEFLDGKPAPSVFPEQRFDEDDSSALEGVRFSQKAVELISGTARSLLAMDADEADAYSYGLNACQLLLDFLKDGSGTDMTLNGPTSYSWLDPWKSYLQRQGVEFFNGQLVGMEADLHEDRRKKSNQLFPTAVWLKDEDDQLFDEAQRRGTPIDGVIAGERRDEPDADREQAARLRRSAPLPQPENPDHEYFGYESERAEKEGQPDFYILALPFEHASRTAFEARKSRKTPDGDFGRLADFDRDFMKRDEDGNDLVQWARNKRVLDSVRDPATGRPRKRMRYPLRDLSGIQFFFPHNARIGDGHVIYADAEWGLTSISQLGSWRSRVSRREGFLGQISVDIGAFYRTHAMNAAEHAYLSDTDNELITLLGIVTDPAARPGTRSNVLRTAWKSEWWEIPIRVWDQIVRSVQMEGRSNLEPPHYYHLDGGLIFRPAKNELRTYQIGDRVESYVPSYPARNETPFLINLPGQWSHRPGAAKCSIEYTLSNGNWLLAGTYMATYTRIMTMEACNESARHAVNVILREIRLDGDRSGTKRREEAEQKRVDSARANGASTEFNETKRRRRHYRSGGKTLGVECRIWDLYDEERRDFEPLKQLDEELFEADLPHFADILEIDQLISDQHDMTPGDAVDFPLGSSERYRELALETFEQIDSDLSFLDRFMPEGKERRRIKPVGQFSIDRQLGQLKGLGDSFPKLSGTRREGPAKERSTKGMAPDDVSKAQTLLDIAQLFIRGTRP